MESNKPETPEYGFERRSEPRFEVELPLEYRRAGAPRLRPGHTVNFSEDGFMLSVSEQMEAGEEFEVKVYFTSSSGLVTVAAVAKVVWEDTDAEEDGYYRFGVRYVDIPAADKETLKTFLNIYADPHQAGAEIKPRAESPFKPRKPSTPEQPGRMDEVRPMQPFLKRLISLGGRVLGESRRLVGL
jgi:hypothetical protein